MAKIDKWQMPEFMGFAKSKLGKWIQLGVLAAFVVGFFCFSMYAAVNGGGPVSGSFIFIFEFLLWAYVGLILTLHLLPCIKEKEGLITFIAAESTVLFGVVLAILHLCINVANNPTGALRALFFFLFFFAIAAAIFGFVLLKNEGKIKCFAWSVLLLAAVMAFSIVLIAQALAGAFIGVLPTATFVFVTIFSFAALGAFVYALCNMLPEE